MIAGGARYNRRSSAGPPHMSAERVDFSNAGFEPVSIIDLIRFGASRFGEAGLTFGHSYDNGIDEATQLVLHALSLPHDLPPAYGAGKGTGEERSEERRVREGGSARGGWDRHMG